MAAKINAEQYPGNADYSPDPLPEIWLRALQLNLNAESFHT